MKPKKKTLPTSKKTTKKALTAKPIMLFDKTIVTTKQRTYNTIEDHFQMVDVRNTARTNKTLTPRTICQEKMEECNLSPFSSNGGSSLSPKYQKVHSPRHKEQKDIKKSKGRNGGVCQRIPEKKRGQGVKREVRAVPKKTKEQQNQTAYQMLLLKRLSQKKITEMSEESSISIPKFTKLQLNIAHTHQAKPIPTISKLSEIRELKQKIQEKVKKQNPLLKKQELKFLCAVVLIQRLWKQRKIKNIISTYISPRFDQNVTADSHREINTSKLSLMNSTQQLTSQLVRKYHFLNANFDKPLMIEKQLNSTQMETARKDQQPINLKDLQLSGELTPKKQAKMIQLVSCLRDITYFKQKKKERKSKMNVFNLQQSLSEKCLMQRFYQKVFKDGQGKKNNFEIFNSKKDQKNLQRSIELIKSMKSPQKEQVIEIQERLQTQLQENQHAAVQTAEVSVETEPFVLETKETTQINTLKQLSLVSQGVIFMLLNEFSQQFYSFTSRSILRKKKKARLPGLKVNSFSIRQYLTGLSQYMMQNYDNEVIRRFCLVKPLSFLKIHHQYDEQDEQYYDEEEQELNMPIVPNTLFYEYQLIYQKSFFTIAEEDKKYCNFLQGLIKIHNLLLANCMSEILEKTRIDRVVLPWDNRFEPQRSCKKKKYGKEDFQLYLSKIIDDICQSAFMRVGQFHKRLSDPDQEKKILKSINQDYKAEGNDWSAQYEYLQLRIELTKSIEQQLLNQIVNDLITFS